MTLKDKKELIRTLKFTLFSISAGIIQVLLFTLLNELLHLDYWISYITSLVASILWNFTINRKVTFKAANDVKRAGERLDLLFGQIKLYDLKQALHTLKSVSDALPEQLDIQLLALWAFTSVPDINDSAQNALVIAKRIEPILNAEQSMPQALAPSTSYFRSPTMRICDLSASVSPMRRIASRITSSFSQSLPGALPTMVSKCGA